jgi:biopolymer transport protein ExbB/TolQ
MWETIQSGGPMMIPLIFSAVLAAAYSIERALVLRGMPTADEAKAELDALEDTLARGGQDAAVARCNEGKGVLNFVFARLLKRHDALVVEQREFQQTNEEIIRRAEMGGSQEMGRFMVKQQELVDLKQELVMVTEEAARGYLSRNLPVLQTIGSISPLLGLLGTITGMIIAFEAIAVAGAGDPRIVALGISQALVTTATGLIIAIPTVVVYRILSRRAEAMLESVEMYGHAFANTLIMSTLSGAPGGDEG